MTNTKLIALASALFASALTVSACAGIISHDETLRYKMTVTISTPDGDKVGSAVREATKHSETSILPEQGGSTYGISKGEAITFNLGEKGTLFALKASQEEAGYVFSHLKPNAVSRVEVNSDKYPMIVRFSNPRNPDSYQVLYGPPSCAGTGRLVTKDNCVTGDHFLEILGNGYGIKSVTIEPSKDAITTGIKNMIPDYDGKYHYINPGTLY